MNTHLFLFLACSVWSSSRGQSGLRKGNTCKNEKCMATAKRILDGMDQSVSPCQDFYRFTCGRFMETAVIPPDSDKASTFHDTNNELDDQMKSVAFGISSSEPRPYLQIKNFMELCMDENKMDNEGLEPAMQLVRMAGGWPVLGGWSSKGWDLTNAIAAVERASPISAFGTLFAFGIEMDLKNASRRLLYITEPKLTLDRKILIAGLNDTRVKAYYDLMVDVAVIFGADRDVAEKQLRESLLLEIDLAKLMRSAEENRNFELSHNPITLKLLVEKIGWLDWRKLLNSWMPEGVSLSDNHVIILQNPNYLRGLDRLVHIYPSKTIANYMVWRAVMGYTSYLTSNLKNREAKFLQDIYGITTRRPRWKECIGEARNWLQHAMASLYVKHFFDIESRNEAVTVATMITNEMKRVLKENDWMDSVTRKKALEKVDKMYYSIGFPDELLDMNKLNEFYKEIDLESTQNFLSAIVQLNKYRRKFEFKQLTETVSKTDWRLLSNIVQANAFYQPLMNTITIPAGILQELFFGKHLPSYYNFGRIGVITGHEITHGFDDQGSQFDGDGNLKDWWDEKSKSQFKTKTQCMIDQFNALKDNETQLNLNGIITQGENVADQGGLKLAYRAWRRLKNRDPLLPGLERYSRKQMFLISLGSLWCMKTTPAMRHHEILSDNHPPTDFRVNGYMLNFPEFHRIFKCSSGDPMVTKNKCIVW